MIGLEERLGVQIAETDYPKLSNLRGRLHYLETRTRSDQSAAKR